MVGKHLLNDHLAKIKRDSIIQNKLPHIISNIKQQQQRLEGCY